MDKYGQHFSSIPVGAYTIELSDLDKIKNVILSDDEPRNVFEYKLVYVAVILVLIVVCITIVYGVKKKRR